MLFDLSDTIAAIASAPGGGVRGIVRLSGPTVVTCLQHLFKSASPSPSWWSILRPTRVVGSLQLGAPLGKVPCDLFLWPTARSYTRQPSAELHLPGSPPIVQAALNEVCRHGARLAQPGEFTLRAFLAGRLDLTQAEAVLGVIDAHSQQQLNTALTQLAGGLSGPLAQLRSQLLDLLAHLEAGLDFVEEDIEFITSQELDRQLLQIQTAIDHILAQMSERTTAGDAFRVVLAGRPNAGKSSLLNALAGEDAALVSPVAGTTRDYVTRELTLAGVRCQLIDTAGLAEATHTPDAAAEATARRLVDEADLVLRCVDVTAADLSTYLNTGRGELLVMTKADLTPTGFHMPADGICTSVQTGQGLTEFREAIANRLRQLNDEAGLVLTNTSARCRDSLQSASVAIARARTVAAAQWGEELVAAEMRAALDDLGQVVGAVYTDDVLDRIFSRFCIGK